MKKMFQVTLIAVILLAVAAVASVCQATPLSEQSELVKSTLKYEKVLTTPDGFPASQRTLIAVNLAAAETRTTDATEIMEAYLIASSQVDDRITRSTEYDWDGNDWVEVQRMTNTYDGAGNNTQILWEDRDGSNWVNRDLGVSTFDGSGRILTTTYQTWETDHWVIESRSTWSYDGSGKILEVLTELWEDPDWVLSSRITFAYSDGLLQTSTSEFWFEGALLSKNRSTYTYDLNNRVFQVVTETWQNDAWVITGRTTNTYDGNGRVTQILTESRSGETWVNGSLFEFAYDGSGNETTESFSFWTGDAWLLLDVDSSFYESGKLVEVIHTDVLSTMRTHTLYFYDGDNLAEEIDQTWDEGALAASTWVNTNRTTYEYEAGGTAVLISDEPAPAGYELNQNYPNPFNPSTSIRYSLQRTGHVEVAIYNMLGQAVKTLESGIQSPGVYETTWDGTDAAGHAVASGIYLYRVATEDFTETRKMMLLK